MFKIASKIQNLLHYAMPFWKVEVASNNQNFGNVEIKRGIFQVGTLSPLLFIIGLIPLTLILRKHKEAYSSVIAKNGLNTYCIQITWNYMGKRQRS